MTAWKIVLSRYIFVFIMGINGSKMSIVKAVNQFPTLKTLIGTKKFLSIAEIDKFSPIIHYLSNSLLDEKRVTELFEKVKIDPKHSGALPESPPTLDGA